MVGIIYPPDWNTVNQGPLKEWIEHSKLNTIKQGGLKIPYIFIEAKYFILSFQVAKICNLSKKYPY